MEYSYQSLFRKCVRYDEIEREFYCQNLGLRKACFIDHLEITSTIVKKDSEEVNNSFTFYLPYGNHNMKGKKQLIYNEKIKAETEAKMGAPVSRFQCVERGTQYRNSIKREVEVQNGAEMGRPDRPSLDAQRALSVVNLA